MPTRSEPGRAEPSPARAGRSRRREVSSGAQEIPPAPRPVFALRAEKGAEPRSGPTEPVARPAPSHVGPGTRGAPAAGGAAVRSPSARAGGGSCSLRSPPPPFLRPPPAGGGAERSGGVLSGSARWGGGEGRTTHASVKLCLRLRSLPAGGESPHPAPLGALGAGPAAGRAAGGGGGSGRGAARSSCSFPFVFRRPAVR